MIMRVLQCLFLRLINMCTGVRSGVRLTLLLSLIISSTMIPGLKAQSVTYKFFITGGTSVSECDTGIRAINGQEPMWGILLNGFITLYDGVNSDCVDNAPSSTTNLLNTADDGLTRDCANQLDAIPLTLFASDDNRDTGGCPANEPATFPNTEDGRTALFNNQACLVQSQDLEVEIESDCEEDCTLVQTGTFSNLDGDDGVATSGVTFRLERSGDCSTPSPSFSPTTPEPTTQPTVTGLDNANLNDNNDEDNGLTVVYAITAVSVFLFGLFGIIVVVRRKRNRAQNDKIQRKGPGPISETESQNLPPTSSYLNNIFQRHESTQVGNPLYSNSARMVPQAALEAPASEFEGRATNNFHGEQTSTKKKRLLGLMQSGRSYPSVGGMFKHFSLVSHLSMVDAKDRVVTEDEVEGYI